MYSKIQILIIATCFLVQNVLCQENDSLNFSSHIPFNRIDTLKLNKDYLSKDSAVYEFQLWIGESFSRTELLIVRKYIDGQFSYKYGYAIHKLDTVYLLYSDSIKKSVNWDEFDKNLDEFISQKIPFSQSEIKLDSSNSSKKYFFDKVSDGVGYRIIYFCNNSKLEWIYSNPVTYYHLLEYYGYTNSEHKIINDFISYLYSSFTFKKYDDGKEISESLNRLKKNKAH